MVVSCFVGFLARRRIGMSSGLATEQRPENDGMWVVRLCGGMVIKTYTKNVG